MKGVQMPSVTAFYDPLTNAPEQHYLFIDGGYLRKCLDVFRDLFGTPTPEASLEFGRIKELCRARRAFYYDCLDDRERQGDAVEARERRIKEQEQFFGNIDTLSGFHVRLGSMSGQQKKARQKKVDVMLAVDMLTFGLSKNMTVATLLAGDADFVPIIEALVRAGTFTRVLFEKRSASRELYHAADARLELSVQMLHQWMSSDWRQAHHLPEQGAQDGLPVLPDNDCMREGQMSTRKALVFFRHGKYTLYIEGAWHGQCLVLTHQDFAVLERYATLHHGTISWYE